MRRSTVLASLATLAVGIAAGAGMAQQQPQGPTPFFVGNRLGLPVNPAADGTFERCRRTSRSMARSIRPRAARTIPAAASSWCRTAASPQNVQTNNAWVSFINHDGSVHTARWIGVQNPAEQRTSLDPPLVLNEPYGSDIANGMLYLADRDGGTTATEPSVAVIRRFNMQTGAPAGETRVERSAWFNDIEVADDGTVYATQTGVGGDKPDPATWQVWKIARDGAAVDLRAGRAAASAERHRLRPARQHRRRQHRQQRGADVLARRPTVKTENAAQAGNDGLVIMPDGTKYVSSVSNGGVSRIRPGQPAELIARTSPAPRRCATTPAAISW